MFLRSDLKIEENISFKGHGPPCTVKLLYAVYQLKVYFNTKLKKTTLYSLTISYSKIDLVK